MRRTAVAVVAPVGGAPRNGKQSRPIDPATVHRKIGDVEFGDEPGGEEIPFVGVVDTLPGRLLEPGPNACGQAEPEAGKSFLSPLGGIQQVADGDGVVRPVDGRDGIKFVAVAFVHNRHYTRLGGGVSGHEGDHFSGHDNSSRTRMRARGVDEEDFGAALVVSVLP
ncbi:hypothetical protein [Micromonospora sp. NPDC049801]|uniref:hypothetical protein n=1 Tax=unclassified Micromonospora TaxID=2617518 RepID=UPI00340F5779